MEDEIEECEESAAFIGPCACDHEEERHGWGSCGVEEDGKECPCEAGWEE